MRLAGKTALITGAARGIGRAFAMAYIREGARVAIGDIDEARAVRTAKELGDNALAVKMDVTDQASIDEAIEHARGLERAGLLSTNSAGPTVSDAGML